MIGVGLIVVRTRDGRNKIYEDSPWIGLVLADAEGDPRRLKRINRSWLRQLRRIKPDEIVSDRVIHNIRNAHTTIKDEKGYHRLACDFLHWINYKGETLDS